uniref:ethanolamine kinase n=1 Tax=Strigamia maritima TaxID=126957 RepID=T1JAR3_STRMM
MAALLLPEFTVHLDAAEDDIKKLFKIVKPEWNEDKIIVKNMSGGFSCLTSRVYLEDTPDDAFTVRVQKLFVALKDNCEDLKLDTKFEVRVVQEISKIGYFPTVHAVFANGFCYKYISGKPLVHFDKKTKTKPEIDRNDIKTMVEKLAEIHMIKLENVDYTKTDFFDNYDTILEKVYPENSVITAKNIIEKEYQEIKSYIKEFNLPIVLCHGDPHAGNVVVDEDKDQLTFVDWELSHIGYQAYDLAYCVRMLHFEGYVMNIQMIPSAAKDQTPEISMGEMLKWYFAKWSKLNMKEFDEEAFEELQRQVKYFELVWCLVFIIMFGNLFANSKAQVLSAEFPVDPTGMVQSVYNFYCRIKEQTLQEFIPDLFVS